MHGINWWEEEVTESDLDTTEEDLNEISDKFLIVIEKMHRPGWEVRYQEIELF